MQINNNGITNNSTNNSAGSAKAGSATQSDSAPATSTRYDDSVELSAEARGLTELEAKVAAAADVDNQRVDAIQRAIADGQYQINAESIADKLLASDDFF